MHVFIILFPSTGREGEHSRGLIIPHLFPFFPLHRHTHKEAKLNQTIFVIEISLTNSAEDQRR